MNAWGANPCCWPALEGAFQEPPIHDSAPAVPANDKLRCQTQLATTAGQLAYEGIDAQLPRQVIREALAANPVRDGQIWIDMLEQRNLMAHTYYNQRAQRALTMIQGGFAPALLELARDLEGRP